MPALVGRLGPRVALAILFGGSISQSSAAPAQITTGTGGQVKGISNLVPREECYPSKLRGRVVKRDFGRNGLYLSGIVLEESNGTRTFVNVDNEYADKDAATVGRIKSALETLLVVGKKVDLGVFACGAAGRVMTVHSIKAL